MCGIFGVIGTMSPVADTVKGLEILEYRGYDSAGIAYFMNDKIKTIKSTGNIVNLKAKIFNSVLGVQTALPVIGHTRWATNGKATEENAHPHLSANGNIAVVHNGIIENYNECVKYLKNHNIQLKTNVDTEVIPNILAATNYDLYETMQILKGDYAICGIYQNNRNSVFVAKHGNMPLHIGFANTAIYVTSDILALPDECKSMTTLDDNEYGTVSKMNAVFYHGKKEVQKLRVPIPPNTNVITKNGFTSFMEKEINDIPAALKNITEYYTKTKIDINWREYSCIHIIGCGTSYHAGLIIGSLFEKNLNVRTKVHIASEFTKDTILGGNEIAAVISQSGETADTLSAMQVLKAHNLPIVAICNVLTSTIAKKADYVLPMLCGTEVAVASTKAFVATAAIGQILAGLNPKTELNISTLPQLPLPNNNINKIFFIGKGIGYYLALEAALKVKEVTYTHCEGYASGELKHGTLSLVDANTLAIALSDDVKTQNALQEISARSGITISISGDEEINKIIPVQIFALRLSQKLGLNPDRPRNLAKSVTVE
jgi:glucosamine--fructose-6-phosphate aminotransferase (isomerizing)